jgi:O-acetyl-ADP-ribose deacetylase (regulator of RNase III)
MWEFQENEKVINMEIELYKGDITKLDVEAIVNPADSYISMGGGLAKAILDAGGEIIRKEAQKYTPVKVGEAIITSAGNLPAKYVIHAPTMETPGETSVENVRLAMTAVLECAEINNIRELAVPGLGTGVGGVEYKEAANVMVSIARGFEPKSIERLIFVAYDDKLYDVFKNAL